MTNLFNQDGTLSEDFKKSATDMFVQAVQESVENKLKASDDTVTEGLLSLEQVIKKALGESCEGDECEEELEEGKLLTLDQVVKKALGESCRKTRKGELTERKRSLKDIVKLALKEGCDSDECEEELKEDKLLTLDQVVKKALGESCDGDECEEELEEGKLLRLDRVVKKALGESKGSLKEGKLLTLDQVVKQVLGESKETNGKLNVQDVVESVIAEERGEYVEEELEEGKLLTLDQVVKKALGESKGSLKEGKLLTLDQVIKSVLHESDDDEDDDDEDDLEKVNEKLLDRISDLERELEQCRAEKDGIESEKDDEVESQVECQVEELTNRVSAYADFVAEQYVTKNEKLIEESSKVLLAEGVLKTVRGLFEAYGFSLKDGDSILRDELESSKQSLQEAYDKLSDALDQKQVLANKVESLEKKLAFNALTESLSQSEKQRVMNMIEGENCNLETFKKKVSTLIENLNTPAFRRSHTIVTDSQVQTLNEERQRGVEDPTVSALAEAMERLYPQK